MDYLTVIHNTEYFHWQIELLIESFKFHGIEDRLVVGVINDTKISFPKNLQNHKRIFECPKDSHKYPPINQPYAVCFALNKGIISQPFTLIHSDTILVKPVEKPEKNLTFSICQQFPRFLKADAPGVEKEMPNILPVGGIYKFNNVPKNLFESLADKIKNITNVWDRSPNSFRLKYWRYANRMAWMWAFWEYSKTDQLNGELLETQLFVPLLSQTEFVHYCYGLATTFHKSMFKGTIILSDSDPISIFANPNNNFTTSTNYCMKIAQSYKKRFLETK